VTLYVWIALGISIACMVGSVGFAAARGLRAWRTFRRFRRRSTESLADVMRRVARIEERMTSAGASAARLQRAQADLQESLATARVLSAALAEVRATVNRVTGLVPSK
jgi:hypothetical protein